MPHETHYPILAELGINAAEALVYELLLELGPKTAQELLSPSGLGRGNLYNTLTSLKKKGLVLEEPGRKTVYKAVDPEALRALARARLTAAQELHRQLEATLPTLKSHYQLITKKPTFRVFEGIEGLKDIYRETLKSGEPIYALVGPEAPDPRLYRWLTTRYVKERVRLNIPAYVAAAGASPKAEEYVEKSKEELRTVVLLDPEQFPMLGEVDVFGNSVAFISYKTEELIGVALESPALATTLRSAIWAILKLKSGGVGPFDGLLAKPSTSQDR